MPEAVVLECVANVSEGRDPAVLAALRAAAGPALLDMHADSAHNRSVLTIGGRAEVVEAGARELARAAVQLLDLRSHEGAHPRLGVVDVVPFVTLGTGHDPNLGIAARDRFAAWASSELELPCFLYGPERSLPAVRRRAFHDLRPDHGPDRPHPTAGAACVGARPVLVAYNLWLAPEATLAQAREIAAALRAPAVRALGLDMDGTAQVSFNLVSPLDIGPAEVYDAVSARAGVARSELVGLIPAAVLERVPPGRWQQLDLDPARTIEGRLAAAGGLPGDGG